VTARDVAIRIDRIEKLFGGLRPLRVTDFTLRADECVAVTGMDAANAEVLVNLLTGATLPDEGAIAVFGQPTSAISDPDQWLASLDRFGLVSSRAVLVEELSAAANIATAMTLTVEPMPADVLARVHHLAAEVGVPADRLDVPVGHLDPGLRACCHLARSLASGPRLLVLEHANALAGDRALAFGGVVADVARRRRLPMLALTADGDFAHVVAPRVLRLDPASGRLRNDSGWRGWWRRGIGKA